nr:hypothetical protein [Micromonospora sp. DSM 115978]
VEAQLITDESWALSRRPDGRYDRGLLLGSGLALWVVWMAGTLAGALGARYVGDPDRFGLDVAFPAMFVSLLAGQAWRAVDAAAAALGAVIVLGLAPFASQGVATTAAVVACLLGLVWSRRSTPASQPRADEPESGESRSHPAQSTEPLS